MQKPKNLIGGIVFIRDVRIRRNSEIHGNRSAEGICTDRAEGNVLFGLPQNGLHRGAVFSRTCGCLSNAGKAKVDAIRGI